MIRLLSLLFIGDWHRHQWAIHDTRRMYDDPNGKGLANGTKYILRCQKCGNMKAAKL